MPKAAQFRQAGVKAEQHEKRIQEAISGVRDKKYPTVAFVCRELGLTAFYHTVNRRFPLLRDIAWTIDLSEDGTRNELIARINAFFDSPDNQHLRSDEHYTALFTSKRALRKRRRTELSDAEDTGNLETTVAAPAWDQLPPFESSSQRRHLQALTNSPVMPNQVETVFEDNDLDGAQPPHAPGDWGLYHTSEALYYPPRPRLFIPTPLNFDERSILSYMRPPPPFYHAQPGV